MVFLLDKKDNKIVENYNRFLPDLFETETFLAIFYIALGIGVVLIIDYYGKKRRK